ncbi:MAG TPA: phosphotransferase [Rhizomicrobium sp.]|jgi:aminoglycoside phosphotransferase (APT) family kinase protein|nr:phosphotransferase [Rhizomicrobium sp.]
MDQDLQNFLLESGLVAVGARTDWIPLSGGVSCDVWRVDAAGRSICVKRALPRLKVAAFWEAPVARSTHEWRWIKFASEVAPDSIPRPLAHDPARGLLAMEYLDPAVFPVWKQLLLQRKADIETASSVADILARLHRASAENQKIAAQFDADGAFYALRIEPYLLEAARRNPQVADILQILAERTLTARIALVHGDVSPKNILVGPRGPVFLDAETAWYGDPAFDLAFCLSHLLLKCLARPVWRDNYLACFDAFALRYLSSVSWEAPVELERRALQLLPALLLARVDGKSPVEYLTDTDRAFVRDFSCRWLRNPPKSLDHLARLWRGAVKERDICLD